jgi:copper chaperone NosL
VLLALAGISLIACLDLPIWSIDLDAPQYPEGLNLKIYANKIGGNVDIINGLNHYIGMKTLHTEDFIEFKVLPYLIMGFSGIFVLASILGNRKFIHALLSAFIAFGVFSMVDFWRWEYNYGHDLNPEAAIIVPGMAYQPPLIGYKQLLNFGAYSMPDIGGYLIMLSGFLLLLVVAINMPPKTSLSKIPNMQTATLISFLLILSSCAHKPQDIKLNKDNCHNCEMTIADKRFGAEVLTKKGRVHKFDDLSCLLRFLKRDSTQKYESFYVTDYIAPHHLIDASKSYFIKGQNVNSPMGGNTAAFENRDTALLYAKKLDARMLSWKLIHP